MVKRWKLLPTAVKVGLALGAVGFLLSTLAGFAPAFVEAVYSRRIFPTVVRPLTFFSSLIPFSLTDFVHTVAIPGSLIAAFVLGFRPKRRWINGSLYLLSTAGLCYFLFQFFWAFNYRRQPVAQLIGITASVEDDVRDAILVNYAKQTNSLRRTLPTRDCLTHHESLSDLDAKVAALQSEILSSLNLPAPAAGPIKRRPFGTLLLKLGNSGIYGPFTGETNITYPLPAGPLAFTIAHERAHRAGFASETDASVVAFLTLAKSPDSQLRYSGQLAFWTHVGKDERVKAGLAQPVFDDIQCIKDFWKKYPPIGDFLWTAYDAYLKSQGQKRGVKTYSDAAEVFVRYLSRTPPP